MFTHAAPGALAAPAPRPVVWSIRYRCLSLNSCTVGTGAHTRISGSIRVLDTWTSRVYCRELTHSHSLTPAGLTTRRDGQPDHVIRWAAS